MYAGLPADSLPRCLPPDHAKDKAPINAATAAYPAELKPAADVKRPPVADAGGDDDGTVLVCANHTSRATTRRSGRRWPLLEMHVHHVCKSLVRIGLAEYSAAFRRLGVDGYMCGYFLFILCMFNFYCPSCLLPVLRCDFLDDELLTYMLGARLRLMPLRFKHFIACPFLNTPLMARNR